MLSIGGFAKLGRVSPRMLRHYDRLGLLRPDHVDPVTGYRSYGVGQLARLHRLLALRDLGFGLDQVGDLLDDDLGVDEIRGMLRLRRAQIEAVLDEEGARLRRVEAHLRALEGAVMDTLDIVVKETLPLRIAQASGTATGYGPPIGEALGPLYGRLAAHLGGHGVTPGMAVAHYGEPAEDGSVAVHAGFALGDQDVPEADGIVVVDLPVVEVASVVHRGSMEDVGPVYEALARWVADSGRRLAGPSRELTLEWDAEACTSVATELQVELAP